MCDSLDHTSICVSPFDILNYLVVLLHLLPVLEILDCLLLFSLYFGLFIRVKCAYIIG
jgi:hypothetical protein